MKKVPVFIIQGFLDSGKSTFITSIIKRDEFYTRGKTLVIACEQGECSYDEEEFSHYNTDIYYFENQEDFTVDQLLEIYKKSKPDRIVFEINFLWDQEKIEFPNCFQISQIITLVDGVTFPIYFANMRQKFSDVFKQSDVIAFTKLKDDRSSLAPYESGIRLINSNCFCCLINEECMTTQEAFDAVLPYDINAPIIELTDQDFGAFYIDTFDHRQDYEGKKISLNAWVVRTEKLAKNEFIAGRKVLTCCANDIQLFGFLVKDDLNQNLVHDSWIHLVATCHIEFNETYQEEEIVLIPEQITIIPEIENPVLDLR